MIRVVYDTNVVVSALLKPGGIPASLVSLALSRSEASPALQLCVSPAVLAEYTQVLNRPLFRFRPDSVSRFLQDLESTAVMAHPTRTVSQSPDEPDNRILECALAANARYLVTGNKKDFPFAEFEGVRIVSPGEFAALLIDEPGV